VGAEETVKWEWRKGRKCKRIGGKERRGEGRGEE
jgi:hypothetical protein